jgi:hypothetical protein
LVGPAAMAALHVSCQFIPTTLACQAICNTLCAYDAHEPMAHYPSILPLDSVANPTDADAATDWA